jgi:hypothetical protein
VALDVNGVTQTIGALTGVAGTSIELNDGSLTVATRPIHPTPARSSAPVPSPKPAAAN